MPQDRYEIDRSKSFERLEHAPIIEAVIEIRCSAEEPWAEDIIKDTIGERLEGYEFWDSTSRFRQGVKIEDNVPITESMEKVGWRGVRYRSKDESYVAAFNRDGFVFSRVGSYETWEQFSAEASRVWEVHKALAQPSGVHRIGLRFINRISLPGGVVDLDDFIFSGPRPPKDLGFTVSSFLHKDSFSVPGQPYLINIVRTESSEPRAGGNVDYAIILDIDVYVQEFFEVDDIKIDQHLENMRVLKNEVFWGSVSSALLESLKGDNG